MRQLASYVFLAAMITTGSTAWAQGSASQDGKVVISSKTSTPKLPDFANAKAMPLPQSKKAPPSAVDLAVQAAKAKSSGPDILVPAQDPTEKITVKPATIPVSALEKQESPNNGIAPQQYGSSGQTYATSRVPYNGLQLPYRRAGKLYFTIGGSTYVCSASLVKKGVIVTAAHCVANFGRSQFYSNWVFVPAQNKDKAPYGVWTGSYATVLTSYYNGSDSCAVSGVVCQNDVGLVVLDPQSNSYPGSQLGVFGYSTGNYGYSNGSALIGQLGYPVALDDGVIMEQNYSQGFIDSTSSNNTVIGSLMTGGSSGGPWVVNLGQAVSLDSSVGNGKAPNYNIIVGVTSWGYTDTSSNGPKQMGASQFTANNIKALLDYTCGQKPNAC